MIGRSQIPYRCFLKWVGRWSPDERMLRVARLVWRRGEGPGFGKGFCAKLSLALRPKLIGFSRGWHEFEFTVFGVRVHYQRSYGGWIV